MKILILKRGYTRFESNDIRFLSKTYDVEVFEPNLTNILRGLWLVYKTDILFYWFPNDYKFLFTLVAFILKKKICVISGGQMATADTKKGRKYAGVKYRLFYVTFARLSLVLADKVIAVSSYEQNNLFRYLPRKRIQLLYNHISDFAEGYSNERKNENLIITITALDKTYFTRKGLDMFLELAANMPEKEFLIIGKVIDHELRNKINGLEIRNLKITGFVSDSVLRDLLNEASVYCQFSRQEGFGVALAEAIAFGCVPVTSSKGAIPEVSGSHGYSIDIDNFDKEQTAQKVMLASKTEQDVRMNYSNHIREKFSRKTREKALLRILAEL